MRNDGRANGSSTRFTLTVALLVLMLLLPGLVTMAGTGSWPGDTPDLPDAAGAPSAPPAGFLGHRPLLEFFTGLSCPSCMAGPHPETEELYAGIRDDDSVPWNYVVFHELNGGGVDGLATEESRARMRHYQPGVSGTPDIEVDGGWHTLGGVYGRDDITTSNTQAALDAATDRYQPQFNPRRPVQSLRNDFKFVNLEVAQHLQGREWVVTVKVSYLGMDRLVLEEDLRGSLYVFMVEDDVTAHSTVLERDGEDPMVLNHNVFRGYAIEGAEFTMSTGEEEIFAGGWEIPVIEVEPGQEYPDGEPVPIKTMDITAVAAVYDLDDTTSSDGAYGNPNPVPRCIQSATPRSSAYDMDNSAEPVGETTVTLKGTSLGFEALIDDPEGVSSAAVHFTTEGADSINWTPVELGVSGEEVCDDDGVCYAYADATASASVDIEEAVGEVWYVVTYSDGLGAMGRTEVLYADLSAAVPSGGAAGVGSGTLIVVVVVALLVLMAVLFLMTKDVTQRRALAALMVLVVIVGGVFAVTSGGGGDDAEDAPDIAFTDLDGNDVSLSDFKGKVVVLDMMATWCPGCRAEMSELREIHKRYGESIELITIDIDLKETEAQLRDFQREYKADWRFAMDTEDHDFLREFRVETIPKIVIIDIHGKVVLSKSAEIPADELAEVIDEAQTGGRAAISISGAGSSLGALFVWAGLLGVLTFFSPCSWPLLPGYMTYYMGLKDSRNQRKSILGGMVAASGIILLFLVIAVLVGIFGSAISQYIFVLEPVVGVMLIAMAILIILDVNINFGLLTWPVKKGLAFSKRMVDRLRKKEDVGAEGERAMVRTIEEGGYVGLFFYGLGYGAASAGCMAPIVIALIILAAAQGSVLGSMVIFMVFALAMAVMMVVITVAVGTYGNAFLAKLRTRFNVGPRTMKVVSSVLLVVVGVYLIAFYAMGLA